MNDWASPEERFVEIPGIVEIRWVSDDPDYYVPKEYRKMKKEEEARASTSDRGQDQH